jgi:hypothetical protein
MVKVDNNRRQLWRDLVAWLLHVVVYGALLLTYFYFVLRYLSGWFTHLFHQHRFEYALAGIAVMIVQAVVLESISAVILRWFKIVRK